MKIKSSRNREITLSFTDICKSCLSREFLTSQTCLLTLFAKIKFSQKFLNLQYLRKIFQLKWLQNVWRSYLHFKRQSRGKVHVDTVKSDPSPKFN